MRLSHLSLSLQALSDWGQNKPRDIYDLITNKITFRVTVVAAVDRGGGARSGRSNGQYGTTDGETGLTASATTTDGTATTHCECATVASITHAMPAVRPEGQSEPRGVVSGSDPVVHRASWDQRTRTKCFTIYAFRLQSPGPCVTRFGSASPDRYPVTSHVTVHRKPVGDVFRTRTPFGGAPQRG